VAPVSRTLRAVYPATFDPPTFGHLDIVRRAARLFDRVVAAVYADPTNKRLLFSVEERVEMLREAVAEAALTNVTVRAYTGLTVELARAEGAIALVRGLRVISDFDWEFQLASMNQQLAPEIETVALMASSKFYYLSSTIVKEIAKLGGDVREWVPEGVARRLEERFRTMDPQLHLPGPPVEASV